MAIEITPIINEPALVVTNSIQALVIADIHLGIEWDLYRSGFSIPSQMEQRLERIRGYIRESAPDRIILLGDVKHNVPQISWQERDEIPYFLESIAEYAPIDILPGNHDGGIDVLLPRGRDIKFHPSRGAVLDGVGYFHGHTWPSPELLPLQYIISAHNHPTICFTDKLGYSIVEPAWIRTKLNCDVIVEHFKSIGVEVDNGICSDPRIFIMPAFNELCGGVAFNESMHDDLLGPVFSSEALDLDNAEVYLLDGTNLGILKNIRKMPETRKRNVSGKKRRSKK